MSGDWEETTFRRIECIGVVPGDALAAMDKRLRTMRRLGWLIPDDAAVDLRPSGFGWAARLIPPQRCLEGTSWTFRRRIPGARKVRAVSGIEMRAVVAQPLESADDAKEA